MLHQDYYVREKLRELGRGQLAVLYSPAGSAPRRAPLVGPAIRGAGRLIRRFGEGLEARAGLEPEPMQLERNPG